MSDAPPPVSPPPKSPGELLGAGLAVAPGRRGSTSSRRGSARFDKAGEADAAAVYNRFSTAKVPVNYVLVFPNEEETSSTSCFGLIKNSNKHRLDKRAATLKKLVEHGLTVTKKESRNGKETYINIGVAYDRLVDHADRIKFRMKVKETFGGGFLPFSRPFMGWFEPASETDFFTSRQRIQLTQSMMEDDTYLGGAGMRMDKLLHDGIIKAYFPLHEPEAREALVRDWGKAYFRFPLPLDDIVRYFGTKVGFYFAFLEYYTGWLVGSAILGAIATYFQVKAWAIDNNSAPIYALVLMIYVTMLLELWKRRAATLAHRWDVLDYKTVARQRPQYHGEKAKGIWYEGRFIFFDNIKPHELPEGTQLPKVREVEFYPERLRARKFAIGYPAIFTMIILVVIVTLGILIFRAILIAGGVNSLDAKWGGVIAGCLNAVSITVLNLLYKKVAVVLTNWENHRTNEEYENQLIFKTWLFVFVNSYVALFYIAFIKGKVDLPGGISDECELDPLVDDGVTRSCFVELAWYLGSIFIFRQFFNNFLEVGLPWLYIKLRQWLSVRKSEDSVKETAPSVYEQQAALNPYVSTFDDLQEVMVQFGYVVLFAPAVPLAGLFAVINNAIEIRTDAIKMLTVFQRARPAGASGIGTWGEVLNSLSVMAVFTNCLIMGLTSNRLDVWLGGIDPIYRILLVFGVEHLLLVIKWALSTLINDRPMFIRAELAKTHFIQDLVLHRELFEDASFESDAQAAATFDESLIQEDTSGENDEEGRLKDLLRRKVNNAKKGFSLSAIGGMFKRKKPAQDTDYQELA